MKKIRVTYSGKSQFAELRNAMRRQQSPNLGSAPQALKVLRRLPEPGFMFPITDEPAAGKRFSPKDRPVRWDDVPNARHHDGPGAVALAKLPLSHLNGKP